jgi:hypothetical protein
MELVHKSPPLIPILSQMDTIHYLSPYLSKSILILFSHLRLGISSGLFPLGFLTKIFYIFYTFFVCHCP